MAIPIPGQRHDRSALILYASETGNSEDAAQLLGGITQRLRFKTKVSAMSGFGIDLNELRRYTVVVFAVSTTGQGDIPENGRRLWKSLLRKSLPPNCLRHVNFTTFGFGDHSYAKFNWAARKLHKRLQHLGANEFYPRGEADEQHEEGTDGAFLPWAVDFKKYLLENLPLPEGVLPIPDEEFLPPKYLLKKFPTPEIDPATSHKDINIKTEIAQEPPNMDEPIQDQCLKEAVDPSDVLADKTSPSTEIVDIPNHIVMTLKSNDRITAPDHFQDVRHLSLVAPVDIRYQPGDILSIFPKNFPDDVSYLIHLQHWTSIADVPLAVYDSAAHPDDPPFTPGIIDLNVPLSRPPTLRDLLTHSLDISSIPRRSFLASCAEFTNDETHRDKLREFANPAYTDEYFDYATRPRRSILEILDDFPSIQIPWTHALALFPRLRCRQFSISSGGAFKHPTDADHTTFHLTIALVSYRTVLRKVRQGVCSRYIAALRPGTKLAVTLTKGSLGVMRNNADMLRRPLLLIAPGTGVAPMRSLLWERDLFLREEEDERDVSEAKNQGRAQRAKTVLLFGARNRKGDFLYEKEWPKLDVKLLTAFSRDQGEKVYVQDVIRREGKMVWEMLRPRVFPSGRWGEESGGGGGGGEVDGGGDRGYDGGLELDDPRKGGRSGWGDGTVIICGSSGKMPLAVRAALVDVFRVEGGMEEEDAEEAVARMERQGRYLQETW